MNQAYSQELRADTSRIIIPVISVVVALISLFFTVTNTDFYAVWHFWLTVVLAPVGGWLSLRYIRQEKPGIGVLIFLFSQYTILAVILIQEWQPGSILPYLFGLLIVASTMLYRAETGFLAWGAATGTIVTAVFYKEGASTELFLQLLGPIVVNFGLAAVAFLSAMEWQYAVQTVSELHSRVQRRRDELFAIQEELKWTNAQLEATNKQLETARQIAIDERDVRTRFMNHVSHELRTPLNAIVNFAHILRLGGRGPVAEEQVDYLDRIEKSGWHLLSVLNDLLDMAQIQAGEFRLHREVTALETLCEEAMTSTRGLILETDLELVRDYPDEWPLVYIDRMRIKQSLINLLGNAVKYTETGYIAMRVRVDEGLVSITVEDSGIGIAAEHFQTIFQEFRQVDESDARRRIGTGLGLPITKHLIERHEGTITVTSEPGKGSAFTLTLPVIAPEDVWQDEKGRLSLKPKEAEPASTAVAAAEPAPSPPERLPGHSRFDTLSNIEN